MLIKIYISLCILQVNLKKYYTFDRPQGGNRWYRLARVADSPRQAVPARLPQLHSHGASLHRRLERRPRTGSAQLL